MSVSISSPSQFSKLLCSSTIVIADYWCGPCKTIAPTYESLAAKHSKSNRVTFAKINVDNQQEIAQQYSVRAMPTFLIFRSGTVINTIRGADVRGLMTAIESAIKLAGPGTPVYSSAGRTLGGTSGRATSLSKPLNFKALMDTLIAFVVLYFTTLFSFDAYGAGESSPFNINAMQKASASSGGIRPGEKRAGAAAVVGKKLGTIADLGRD